MVKRLSGLIRAINNEEKGITGLETAIILIAFVTVASVLAYSVLSAGIFSAERGKETVYRGLETAQSTLELKGSLLGLSDNITKLDNVQFALALTLADETVDTRTIVFNYFDDKVHYEGLAANISLSTGSTERGAANMIEGDEVHIASVSLPADANVTAYQTFTIQIVPPKGATITLKRTLPGSLLNVMDLY
jgi:flagellin FlaB